MFGHGRSGYVKIQSSPDELNDLTKHNTTELDAWVVERFIVSTFFVVVHSINLNVASSLISFFANWLS